MKHYHSIRNTREFSAVYNSGNSKANKYLVMYLKENYLDHNRFGISVSKKVGNSVVRHHMTRLLRESYRLNQQELKVGYDIVVVVRNQAKDKGYMEIESAFLHLVKLHHLRKDD